MNSNTQIELKSIKSTLEEMRGEFKTVTNLIRGSGYGEDGMIAKQKQDREDIKTLKKEVSLLKRLSVEIAFVAALVGANLKAAIEWIFGLSDHDQD